MNQTSLIILTGFVSNVELGKFAVAQKVGFFLRMFPVMVTQSILQKSAILYKKSEEDLVSYLNNIYKYSITVSFFLFLIILLPVFCVPVQNVTSDDVLGFGE